MNYYTERLRRYAKKLAARRGQVVRADGTPGDDRYFCTYRLTGGNLPDIVIWQDRFTGRLGTGEEAVLATHSARLQVAYEILGPEC